MRTAFITGLAGQKLGDNERAFLKSAQPAGIILFARNIDHPEQVRRIVGDARSILGDDALVLIDQEGGRVQRLRPPHWRALPPAAAYGRTLRPEQSARVVAQLTGRDLRDLGINCNCVPVLDVPAPGSHQIIGDRAYGDTPETVARIGGAAMQGLIDAGVVPVIKHIPGHGRALADSHLELPVVRASRAELTAIDFAPFKSLSAAPAAMTAHVVYSALDPDHPASTSPRVHADVIRGDIGFDGLLMSDDLSMKALTGPMRARAAAVIAAGSDLALHCNGDMAEMEAVAIGAGSLAGKALGRFGRALAVTRSPAPLEIAAAEACLAEALTLST